MVSLCLIGCSASNNFTQQEIIRAAVNTPDYFENRKVISGDKACSSPLTDPRDGTQIKFLRADWPLADYKVPEGKYGVRSGELLRISCETGEAIGVVKK